MFRWEEGWLKIVDEGACRACGNTRNLHPHHIVPKSLRGDNHGANCCPLCWRCHRDVHGKRFDLGPLLTPVELAHVYGQIGEGRGERLLWPSRTRERRAAA